MRSTQLRNILKSHTWKDEEAPTRINIIDQYASTYLEPIKTFGRSVSSVCIYSYEKGYSHEWVIHEELKKNLRWLLGLHRSKKDYLLKQVSEFELLSKRVHRKYLQVQVGKLKDVPFEDLGHELKLYSELGKMNYSYSIIAEVFDIVPEEEFLKLLPRKIQKEAASILEQVSSPDRVLYLDREKIGILQLAYKVVSNNAAHTDLLRVSCRKWASLYPELYTLLEEHQRAYHWMQNGFTGSKEVRVTYFYKELQNIVRGNAHQEISVMLRKLRNKANISAKNIQEIYATHAFSKKSQNFFDLLRLMAYIQDVRKEMVQKQAYCTDQILRIISKKRGVAFVELQEYFVHEIDLLVREGIKISKQDLKDRQKMMFFTYIKDKKVHTEYLLGESADIVLEHFSKIRHGHTQDAQGQVRGFVASQGALGDVFEGRVRIIMDPKDADVQADEILVTGMTRPDFVPLMKKAKATITNEGGITTHAAIVSRELKKPCIIGTKVATEIFKDGDLVEMDMLQGMIRKSK